jgi:serine/threonine protein kinase
LLAAFDHVVTSGHPGLVLVSGYSGIGKSAVVNGLHKALCFLRPGHRYCHGSGQAPRARPRPKDIKPTNILVNGATGEVKLTGFGIASPLPRERPSPEPPETIVGTLAYMAPEQTPPASKTMFAAARPNGRRAADRALSARQTRHADRPLIPEKP